MFSCRDEKANRFEEARPSTKTVIQIALLSRFVVWLFSYATHQAIQNYDTSSELLFSNHGLEKTIWNIFGQFIKWDAVYFVGIAENAYQCEQFFAFLPGFPYLLKLWASVLDFLTAGNLGFRTCLLLSGFLVSNVSFIFSAVALFWASSLIARNSKEALMVVILYCLSPANVFLSAVYTESLFCLFSFLGFYFFLSGSTWKATCMFFLCSCVRSNALLYIGFIAWTGVIRIFQSYYNGRISIKGQGTILIITAVQTLLVLSPYVAFQYFAYRVHCTNDVQSPWCNNYLPHIYPYVQSHYWNQGFLKYWQVKQIPNFLIAMPTVVITTMGATSYFRKTWSLARSNRNFISDWLISPLTTNGFYQQNPVMFVLVAYWMFFMIFCMVNFHVQTITRFFSSIPAMYWYTATYFFERDAIKGKLLLFYFWMYNIIGITLFVNFYPWT